MEGNKMKTKVLDAVLDQIQLDVANGDYSAILEMLQHLPLNILQGYLPEVITDQTGQLFE
jgi:hypothetical protein